MGLIQFIQKPSNPPSQVREEPKQLKWEERYAQEILGKSACPELARFIDAEFNLFQTYKQPLERRMEMHVHNYKGEYGSDFRPLPDKSDIFIRRTRERVSTYRQKILEFWMPLVGKPWGMEEDPDLPMEEVKDPAADAKEDAITAINKAEAEARIERMLRRMNFKHQLLGGSMDYVLHGCMVLRGPRTKADPRNRALRLRKDKFKLKANRMPHPFIETVPLEKCYWDPQVRSDIREASAFQVIHHLTAKQLRELATDDEDGFDKDQIEALIATFPQGQFRQTNYETLMRRPVPMDQRFTVVERWGLVPDKLQSDWEARGGVMPEGWKPTKGYLESWTCGPFVLKCKSEDFYRDELPFALVALERVPTGPEGQGVGDFILDIQALENAIARALHDNLADSSEPMAEIDMTQIDPGANLDIYAGKRWQKRPNELAGDRPAVDLKLIPNNSPQLVQAFQLFEGLVPTSTSLPTFVDGGPGGSGVRTIGQQKDLYAQAESFIRLIIMESDLNLWERVIGWLYDWLLAYDPDPSPFINLNVTVDGVRGAVRREQIATQFMNLGEFLSKSGSGDYLNMPKMLEQILPHAFGLDENEIILNPAEKAAKDASEAQKLAMTQAMQDRASQMATHGLKAQTTKADALLEMAKSAGSDNPAWGPLVLAAIGAQGAVTPQLQLGLQAWAYQMADKLAALNPSQMASDMTQLADNADDPLPPEQMDPQFRPQQGAHGQPQGPGGAAPAPAPAPAIPGGSL